MSQHGYLLDTHALVHWRHKTRVSQAFIDYLDEQDEKGNLFVSSFSFLEIGLLVQKGRVEVSDVQKWKNQLLTSTNARLIDANADVLIASTELPLHHKDPFDRVLIAQAIQRKLIFVTRDREIKAYAVMQTWID